MRLPLPGKLRGPKLPRMTISTFAYMSFPGIAAEAFKFYHSVFGGDLHVITYGEQIDAGIEFPFDAPREAVANGFLSGPFSLTGGDDLQRSAGKSSPGDINFTAEVSSQEEGEQLIEKLTADGGLVHMPFAVAPWGDHFGVVEDRFGVRWNVTTSSDGGQN